MTKKVYQIGIIGGGMIGLKHMENFRADSRTQNRWIADISPKAAKTSAKEFDIPYVTGDYKEMLKDPELDAVVVCTPPDSHKTIAIDVMRADKHLLLEKPMATTPADAKAIVREASNIRTLSFQAAPVVMPVSTPNFLTSKILSRQEN